MSISSARERPAGRIFPVAARSSGRIDLQETAGPAAAVRPVRLRQLAVGIAWAGFKLTCIRIGVTMSRVVGRSALAWCAGFSLVIAVAGAAAAAPAAGEKAKQPKVP